MKNGKSVLITGASHGIGAALAEGFARNGYSYVGINYNQNQQGAEETALKVEAQGSEAGIFHADVSDSRQCEDMMTKFIERFGKIDVLINNAGGALKIPDGGFEDIPVEYWDNQINLNLSSAYYTSRIAIRDMLAKGIRGRIINISSIHAQVTWVKRKMLPYCAAKGGLNMLTKSLGVEVAKHGIGVNCIAPGFIMTKISSRYSERDMNGFLRKIPVGRLGCVDDITPLALFLADESKSGFIVGQTFTVDGGQSIDGVIDCMLP